MPYLSIKVDYVRAAWLACTAGNEAGRSASNQELAHARRIAVVHVPQDWPHGVVCRNCHSVSPCAAAEWAFGVLKAMRWELCDLFELLELTEASR
jgi:hypothetical protein